MISVSLIGPLAVQLLLSCCILQSSLWSVGLASKHLPDEPSKVGWWEVHKDQQRKQKFLAKSVAQTSANTISLSRPHLASEGGINVHWDLSKSRWHIGEDDGSSATWDYMTDRDLRSNGKKKLDSIRDAQVDPPAQSQDLQIKYSSLYLRMLEEDPFSALQTPLLFTRGATQADVFWAKTAEHFSHRVAYLVGEDSAVVEDVDFKKVAPLHRKELSEDVRFLTKALASGADALWNKAAQHFSAVMNQDSLKVEGSDDGLVNFMLSLCSSAMFVVGSRESTTWIAGAEGEAALQYFMNQAALQSVMINEVGRLANVSSFQLYLYDDCSLPECFNETTNQKWTQLVGSCSFNDLRAHIALSYQTAATGCSFEPLPVGALPPMPHVYSALGSTTVTDTAKAAIEELFDHWGMAAVPNEGSRLDSGAVIGAGSLLAFLLVGLRAVFEVRHY